jgi:hypothetical protein
MPFRTLVTDGARENVGKTIKRWLKENNIHHHITTPYHHESNGRIERFNRTVLEGFNKLKMSGTWAMRIKRIVDTYNGTYHSSIETTPREAQKEGNREKLKEIQFVNRIRKNMKREKFESTKLEINQEVLMKEESQVTKDQPKFKEIVKVIEIGEFDTYMVKGENNKVHKRHISQLRPFQRGGENVENFT